MSVANQTPFRSRTRINFADPGGVGAIVVGAENRTARDQFDLQNEIIVLDAIAVLAPAAADNHQISTRRLNSTVTDLFMWTEILPANVGLVKGFLPKGIGAGQQQFIAEELVAATAGVDVFFTFNTPLNG